MISPGGRFVPIPGPCDHIRVPDTGEDLTSFLESHSFTATLSDGTRVLVRPVGPDDKEALVAGLREMSPQSRILRFLQLRSGFSHEELEYLTELDYENHFAWAAIAIDEEDAPGIGVGRYVRDAADPATAEAAVAVIDRYQRRGVGGLLLRAVAESAVQNGVRRFRGFVSEDNDVVLDRVARHGGRVGEPEDGVVPVEFDLPLPFDTGSELYAMLRAAAAGKARFEPPRS